MIANPLLQAPQVTNTQDLFPLNLLALSAADNLLENILRPTLTYLGVTCVAMEQLLLGTLLTTARLSALQRNEQAIGPYAITPEQHTEIWDKHLALQPELASKIRGLASQHCFLHNPHAELGYNLGYATAIAWLIYERQQLSIGSHSDLPSLARIWERSYPHRGGRAQDFLRAWRSACKAASPVSA
ncbi:hypothetical protein ACS8E9_08965 [Pseudomonas neustonica]|uniref:Uncharacterized protein n=1 Tax=Pseudomonas neustonica TaxID=2487346 RepID=A0ABX9XF30_9PSED|nr:MULTISPECIES: hypothetical protein [Pseudomonas]ROZ81118.1 hypothetical protein EF099_15560 [Pseudomonas sp. SSM44]ROZ82373.1 hypothetical protein EF096_15170 [Pseudomonas neustonica]